MTGPSETILTWCEDCQKFVEDLLLHTMGLHPAETEKLLKKRHRELARYYRARHRGGL